jgi:ABC-type multidrug transport system fused ATPase/permease subunit
MPSIISTIKRLTSASDMRALRESAWDKLTRLMLHRTRIQKLLTLDFRIARLIKTRDKKILALSMAAQTMLAFVDLLGILLIGLVGSLSVNGIQSKANNEDFTFRLLDAIGLSGFSFQQQVFVLSAATVILFMFKTLASLWITKRTILFVALRGPKFSSTILEYLFAGSAKRVNQYSQQELIQATTVGVQSLTSGIIGNSVNIVSDFLLLIFLGIGLTIFNPSLSISAVILFTGIGLLLNKLMKKKAFSAGSQEMKLQVEGNQKLTELLDSYREAVVRNTSQNFILSIEDSRFGVSGAVASKTFMPYISKYVMEASMILGCFAIAGIQFALFDAKTAIMGLAIFLGAASRIAPAILRIQQALIQINGHLGQATLTIDLLSQATALDQNILRKGNSVPLFEHDDFSPAIRIENLFFKYSDESVFEIRINSLHIEPGSHVAFVGPSGSGKSTIVDLILGIQNPSAGQVMISGVSPLESFQKFPGATAYVPQKISIANRSLRENILLGYSLSDSVDAQIIRALSIAGLSDFFKSLEGGLDAALGESGFKISGGQRQRIGIARALFTNPKLIVLDEATSSLDAQTEDDLSFSIKNLSGEVTVISIAHRLSTIKDADSVVYVSDGKIMAIGSFEEVRATVPDFDNQAQLMGL